MGNSRSIKTGIPVQFEITGNTRKPVVALIEQFSHEFIPLNIFQPVSMDV